VADAAGKRLVYRVAARRAATLGWLALAAFAAAPASSAFGATSSASNLTFSAVPLVRSAYFQFRAVPGSSVNGRLRLTNTSRKTLTVLLRPTDVGTANGGGATFDPSSRGQAGRWVTVAERSVVLRPHQSKVASFRVKLPANVTAGEHYAGLVAFDRAQLGTGGKAAKSGRSTKVVLRHVTRVGLPIRITVPGPITRKLQFTGASFDSNAGGAMLRLGLRNSGDEIVRETSVSLKAVSGARTVMRRTGAIRDFVPGATIRFPVAWPGQPARGTYHLTGTVQPAGAPAIHINQDVSFGTTQARALKRATGQAPSGSTGHGSALIWLILGVAIVVAFGMTVAYMRMRREVRRARG
jgi:hypothetical protein